ncbi:hypothetical protein ACFL0Z_02890 [Patescibacteria group bacterium]
MKPLLVLSLVLAIIGITAIIGSGYFAVNKYFLQAEAKPDKVLEQIDDKLDSDRDGLTDKEEIEIHKTNPNNPDTDNDGYSDKTEVDGGFDPLQPPS